MGLRDEYEFDPDTYTGEETSGLLGRLLAQHVTQSQYQPVPDDSPQPAVAPKNRDSRRFSQASAAAIPPQGASGPSNLPRDQSRPVHSPFGNGAALDLLRTSIWRSAITSYATEFFIKSTAKAC